MSDSCSTCKFFKPLAPSQPGTPTSSGLCRRNSPNGGIVPPGSPSQAQLLTFWPVVDQQDWCGDWVTT